MRGVWSDETTLYVLTADRNLTNPRGKIFAYSLSDGNRRKPMDISLPTDNAHPSGLTGRDGVLYVGDNRDKKVYAYDMETRSRRSEHDVNGIDTLRKEMTDLWTDGDTVWISYWLGEFIRAYGRGDRRTQTRPGRPARPRERRPNRHSLRRVQPVGAGPSQRHHLRVRRAPVGRTNHNAHQQAGPGNHARPRPFRRECRQLRSSGN